jgi:hypothetical protein
MNARTTRLLRSAALAAAAATLGPLAVAPTAGAASTHAATALVSTSPAAATTVLASAAKRQRLGRCRGAGIWQLDVERAGRRRMQVEFEVDNVGNRQRWQVFVSANGRRLAAVSRWSGSSGEFEVNRFSRNRRGRDRVAAAAVNTRTGNRCTGRLRF